MKLAKLFTFKLPKKLQIYCWGFNTLLAIYFVYRWVSLPGMLALMWLAWCLMFLYISIVPPKKQSNDIQEN